MTLIAATMQAFFSDRLAGQLQASSRTIASYRDTLRLLLHYTHRQTGKPPSALDWDDLDEELISGFLEHLETVRGNAAKTRNLRLTAIRSCSRTRRSGIQNTRTRSQECSRSHPNATNTERSPTCPRRRLLR
jgi:site-specific recombinase XerC